MEMRITVIQTKGVEEGREKLKEKERKKKDWYKRGGYETVIFVPCTQDSMLLKKLQRNIDKSQLQVKLIEKAGTTLGNLLRTSDPRKDKKCDRTDLYERRQRKLQKPGRKLLHELRKL